MALICPLQNVDLSNRKQPMAFTDINSEDCLVQATQRQVAALLCSHIWQQSVNASAIFPN